MRAWEFLELGPVQLGRQLSCLTGAGGVLLLFIENCQETSERDTANKRSLELCASIVLVFSGGCCVWCVCDVFLTGLVLSNWYP